jgi:lipid A oxidase
MIGGLAIGRTTSQGRPRDESGLWLRSGARSWSRSGRTLNALSALAAAALLTASTAASVMEQSRLDEESGRASVEGTERAAAEPGAETVVGAYGGAPYTYPSPVTIGKKGDSFTIDPVHWYTDPFHNPIYYGARIVRWFSGRAGMMLDFMHSKAIARPNEEATFSGTIDGKPLPPRARVSEIMKKLEFSHGHNMLMLTGLVRLPGIGPRLSPYAGLGGGVLLPHTEVELAQGNHPRTYEYNFAGPTGQALVGLEIRLSRMSFFVEYKFTYADYDAPLSEKDGSWLGADLWRQLKRWIDGEPPPGGHISTTVASHQVVSGLLVRFVPHAVAP